VWAKKIEMHTPANYNKELSKISENKASELATRLGDTKHTHFALMIKEQEVLARELKSLDFNPKINEKSKQIAAEANQPPLSVRQKMLQDAKAKKIEKLSADKLAKEALHLRPAPDTTTPCVCGGSPGLSSDSNGSFKHTEFCAKFMDTCTRNKLNQRYKAKTGRSSVANMYDVGAETIKKIIKMREEKLEKEKANLTFHPAIDKNTDKVIFHSLTFPFLPLFLPLF